MICSNIKCPCYKNYIIGQCNTYGLVTLFQSFTEQSCVSKTVGDALFKRKIHCEIIELLCFTEKDDGNSFSR